MKNRKRRGIVLILSMFLLSVILLLAGVFLEMTVLNMMHITKSIEMERAAWIARAGISQQIHNMKSYWFLNQQKVWGGGQKEGEEGFYSGGSFRVGTATLIGRGFHNALIVCVGKYPVENEQIDTSKIKSVCEAVELSMNTPSDFVNYVDCTDDNGVPYTRMPFCMVNYEGTIHVNGDMLLQRGYSQNTFVKSSLDYGPVISVSNRLYIDNGAPGGTIDCIYGEGIIPDAGFSYPGDITKLNPARWFFKSGYPVMPNGAFDYDRFADQVKVEHEAPDGSKYSYNLLEDKTNGGIYFKDVPKTNQLTWDRFKDVVPDDWHITGSDSHGLQKIYRENECIRNPGSGTGLTRSVPVVNIGRVSFDFNGFTAAVPDNRDMRFASFLYLNYTKANPYVSTSTCYALGLGHRGTANIAYMDCYTIDRPGRKFIATFPMSWNGWRFRSPPGQGGAPGGTIRAYNRYFYDKVVAAGGVGQYSTTVDYPPIVVDPDFPTRLAIHSKVYMPAAAAWASNTNPEDVWTEVADLSSYAPLNRVFTVDYTTGLVTFGDNNHGKRPSNELLRMVVSRSYDFDTTAFNASLDPTVMMYELDLGKITPDNCPRDPKYPDDPDKYGVIYAEVPLLVYGVPKAPVTVICTQDVYLGPVNSDYIKPTFAGVDDAANYNKFSLIHDDARAFPVSVQSGKMVWYDQAFSPFNGVTNSKAVQLNRFGALKYWHVNKCFVYCGYPQIKTATTWSVSGLSNTVGNGGPHYTIGSGYGGAFYADWYGAYWYYYEPRTIDGAIYFDAEQGAYQSSITQGMGYRWGDGFSPRLAYTSSFRTNPPPRMPLNVFLTNWKRVHQGEILTNEDGTQYNKLVGETFIEMLDAHIKNLGVEASKLTYTPEYAKMLSQMINLLEGGEDSSATEE